jgi:hypothetical protein
LPRTLRPAQLRKQVPLPLKQTLKAARPLTKARAARLRPRIPKVRAHQVRVLRARHHPVARVHRVKIPKDNQCRTAAKGSPLPEPPAGSRLPAAPVGSRRRVAAAGRQCPVALAAVQAIPSLDACLVRRRAEPTACKTVRVESSTPFPATWISSAHMSASRSK